MEVELKEHIDTLKEKAQTIEATFAAELENKMGDMTRMLFSYQQALFSLDLAQRIPSEDVNEKNKKLKETVEIVKEMVETAEHPGDIRTLLCAIACWDIFVDNWERWMPQLF